MRTSWNESGQAPEAFGNAMTQLKDSGLVRIGHSTAGPVAQLTKQGFSLGQQKRKAPAVERRTAPQAVPTPPIMRRRRVEYLNSPRIAEQHSTDRAKAPEPSISKQAHEERADVTHAGVFSSQAGGPTPNALQLCVLGLLRNRRLRANGQLDYACVLEDWMRMDLRHDDLLLAIKRLSEQREVETINHPKERVMLTQRGFDRYENPPKSMDDGMDRWQAKKCLRATKRLGALPAA